MFRSTQLSFEALINCRVVTKFTELLDRNNDGELPLHLACKHEKNSDLVKYFLSFGIYREQLTAKNNIFGNTPLHVAAFHGNEMIVDTIMSNCDERIINELLKSRNKLGDTPVHAAAAKNHLRFVIMSV